MVMRMLKMPVIRLQNLSDKFFITYGIFAFTRYLVKSIF